MPNTSATGEKQEPTPEAADRILAKARRTLVGRFFHTFVTPDVSGPPRGETARHKWISQQGVVDDDLGDGYYLVDHFEWLVSGRPFSSRHVVHLDRLGEED